MIRRISKHNDLKDYIKSCPSGVIDDIYKIEYYVQGNNVVIECSFTKVGDTLDVVIPTSQLSLLPNGILMRRAYYKVVDTSYPDSYYNLEFEDCMNIWLGDYESEEPIIPEYVTEEELASELTSYATKDWVDSQQFLTSENLPSDLATQSWVESQGYLTAEALDKYITDGDLEDTLSSYATQSWVLSQGYITVGDLPSGLATQSWVESYTYDKSTIDSLVGKAQGDALYEAQEWVSSQQFATQSWVQSQSYLTSASISTYVTESAIESMGFATQSWVSSNFLSSTALTGYATESWVSDNAIVYDSSFSATIGYAHMVNLGGDDLYIVREDGEISGLYQGVYITDLEAGLYTHTSEDETYEPFITGQYLTDMEYVTQDMLSNSSVITSAGLATQSWVSSNFLSSVPDTYATKSWVSSQQFATESWVSAQDFLEESKVWVGTREYWEMLTSEEQAAYKIALVTG